MLRDSKRQAPAHVIVLGNEKGGSGKSTTAMHVVVALLKSGARVASIDTDGRQASLTRYVENRALWARRTGLKLELPSHFRVPPAEGEVVADIEDREFRAFAQAVSRTEHGYDYVVVDTAGSNTYLMRVSHAMADTLVTPINDSFVDFDAIARVDPETYDATGPSHYAELVRESFRQRALVDERRSDWIVVRNRLSPLRNRNQHNLVRGLEQMAGELGFRIAEGITERLVYREFFPRGLTALDAPSVLAHAGGGSGSQAAAREEIGRLLGVLGLPLEPPEAPRVADGRPSRRSSRGRGGGDEPRSGLHGAG